MSSFTFPITFGSLAAGNQPLSDFDQNFNAAGNMGVLGCSASGTNTVTLTSLSGYPTLTSLANRQLVGFVPVNSTTGPTTIGYSGLTQYNAYQNDGTTRVGNGDLLVSHYYQFAFDPSLNSSAGGWRNSSPLSPALSSTPTFTSVTFSPTTSGIEGTTTNDNAGTGIVGEYFEATLGSGSAINLTSGVPVNVVSLPLTAGDWDVEGNAAFIAGTSTMTSTLAAGISETSAVLPSAGVIGSLLLTNVIVPGNYSLPTGRPRISLPSPTTIFLVARSDFTASTTTVYGQISARRPR